MAGNGTYFKVDRKIFNSDIWLDIVEFRLFFYLIGQARFKKEPIKKGNVEIGRGQYLRSYRNLQSDLEYIENNAVKQYSLSRIKNAVDNLVNKDRIKTTKTQLGTLFEVVNYSIYQGKKRYKNSSLERSKNGERTERERSLNNTKNVKKEKNENKEIYSDVISHLNKKAGRNFKYTTDNTQKFINGRLDDGYELDDFKEVIDKKVQDWQGDEKMEKYIRPQTLFRPSNFEDYLNEPWPEDIEEGDVLDDFTL